MSLRDSQSALAEKAPSAEPDGAARRLGFESGGEYWLVDLAAAGEVVPVPALHPVPSTRPWFRGIANIRGTLYSVTDLADFHGREPTPIRMQTRLLLSGRRSGNLALLIAGTQGLRSLADLENLAASENDAKPQPWRGNRYCDRAGRTWTELLLPVLFTAPEFLDIAA